MSKEEDRAPRITVSEDPVSSILYTADDAHDAAVAIARDAVRATLKRAEYSALKVLAWRFPSGAHIVAFSTSDMVEHHAVYVSSDEVIHKMPPDGKVVAQTWLSFVLQFPQWRLQDLPETISHVDSIIQTARARVGTEEGYGFFVYGDTEHFVLECYGKSTDNILTTKGLLSFTGGMAGGAAVAYPFAVSTVPVYVMGVIPWGTTTVVSGSLLATGAALGAVATAALAVPALMYFRGTATVDSACSALPFCIINETASNLYIKASAVNSSFNWLPGGSSQGKSEGELAPDNLLELAPPELEEEFRLVVSEASAGTWMMGALSTRNLEEKINAVVRRGSVYCVRGGDPPSSLLLKRVPRGVLPAYSPW